MDWTDLIRTRRLVHYRANWTLMDRTVLTTDPHESKQAFVDGASTTAVDTSAMHFPIKAYQVNAFASRDAIGSPTGVVLSADALDDDSMLTIGRRLNFSHTAFLSKSRNPACVFAIRFVTPHGELKNCAHATIAAHYFWAERFGAEHHQPTKQETATGVQEVCTTETDNGLIVCFRQNTIVQQDVDTKTVRRLTEALGCSIETLHSDYPVRLVSPGSFRFLVPLRRCEDLLALGPEFVKLDKLCREVESIGCFAFWIDTIGQSFQAHGRMFAPTIGVDEDAINGNSSGCLGAYLLDSPIAQRRCELEMRVFQGHNSGTPAAVNVAARRKADRIETHLGGSAIVICEVK